MLRLLVAASTVSLLVAGTSAWAWNDSAATHAGGATSLPSAAVTRAETQQHMSALMTLAARQTKRLTRPRPFLLAAIPHALPITARPGGGRIVGQMPAGSRYYQTPHVAWVLNRAKGGRYGKVTVPYSGTRTTGWIRLAGLKLSHTRFAVRVDLSRHRLVVTRLNKVIARFAAATGAPYSATPPGRYFVTDRVPFSPDSVLGAFAFGISGIQPHLPAGWSGGDQLAIHGTNDPSSIGRSVSAGCLRVSQAALERLKPWLTLGTPVVIRP